MLAVTEISLPYVGLGVIALIQLGVFGWVFGAGSAKHELMTLSRLMAELSSTVASLSVAVAKGEANDVNHASHLQDLSTRLSRIESELRTGSRAGAAA